MMPSVSVYTWSRAATRHGPPALADTASSSAVCKASWRASQSSIAQEYPMTIPPLRAWIAATRQVSVLAQSYPQKSCCSRIAATA